MTVNFLDLVHIEITVPNAEEAYQILHNVFGAEKVQKRFANFLDGEYNKVIHVGLGDVVLKFIEPLAEGSSWHNQLKTKGSGVHNLTFGVESAEGTANEMERLGGRVFRSGGFFLGMKLASLRKIMEKSFNAIEEAKKDLDIGPYIFLFIMAVSKEFQGKGFGGKFLRAIIEKSEIERKPIYLETQNEKNVGLYEKFGFHVVKKVEIPDPVNLPMWLMVRDAK